MANLTREELLEKIDEIELYDDLKADLDFYLETFILNKDLHLIKRLLEAGANPNPSEDLDDYILYLLHEYKVEHTLRGEVILEIAEALLKNGANPNRVVENNLRAYDYSIASQICMPFSTLLIKYGAVTTPREPI